MAIRKEKGGGGGCMGEMKRRKGREGEGKREQFIPPKDPLASKLLTQKRPCFLVSVIFQEFI